jgi:hypothetical protein
MSSSGTLHGRFRRLPGPEAAQHEGDPLYALVLRAYNPCEPKMTQDEMAAFVVRNVEPLTDKIYGNRYRVAAHLKDGTYLPCVVLQSK